MQKWNYNEAMEDDEEIDFEHYYDEDGSENLDEAFEILIQRHFGGIPKEEIVSLLKEHYPENFI